MVKNRIIAALLAIGACSAATADAPRNPVNREKNIKSYSENHIISGVSTNFSVNYLAGLQTQLVEHGNCGAFSCDLSCTIHGRDIHLTRVIEVRAPGKTPEIIGVETWRTGDDKFDYGANCNNTESTHMVGFVNRNLGRWENKMLEDKPKADQIIFDYRMARE